MTAAAVSDLRDDPVAEFYDRHPYPPQVAHLTDPLSGRIDFADPALLRWRPIRVPTATAVAERTPPGAAAALLNRAHTCTDLVMFVTAAELEMFRRIDGERSVGELGAGARPFVERLFRRDLVVIDASAEVSR